MLTANTKANRGIGDHLLMNPHKRLTWVLLYLYIIYRKNVVYCTDSSTKTGVDLSLKATAATNEFDYNRSGKTITYTAKANFGFKSVKTGNKVVWSTDNASEYASKVVLDGKGKKQKEVTIHLPNNTTKVFKRDDKGKPWTEVSPQAKESAKTAGTTPAGGASQSGGGGTQ